MSYPSKSLLKKPKRTNRDLSHTHVTTVDSGKLVPIFCEPVVPGDTFRMRTEIYMRFQALLAPVMDRMNVYCHWFFVPNRIIWEDWRQFITKGSTGEVAPVYPRLKLDGEEFNKVVQSAGGAYDWYRFFGTGSVYNYLGFPNISGSENTIPPKSFELDLLPFMAYYRIWCDYYRDENLSKIYNGYGQQVEEFEPIQSGIFTTDAFATNPFLRELFSMRYRAWEKDYFTSALPWAQRGADVIIPGTQGGSSAPDSYKVIYNGQGNLVNYQGDGTTLNGPSVTDGAFTSKLQINGETGALQVDSPSTVGGTRPVESISGGDGSTHEAFIEAASIESIVKELEVIKQDVSRVSDGVADVGTINNLRRANALQKYLEAMARGGSRYIEQIKAIFGVTSSDARLQRAEYLGGSKQNVVISEVLQQSGDSTSPTGEEQPLGSYAGRAVSGGTTKTIKRFFEEHGYLMCIMSVKPRSSYMNQGLPRKYSKFDPYDYLNPYFANLGEQEIKNKELYFMGLKDPDPRFDDEGTFGYAPRYAEYTYCPSHVSGEMGSTLAFWNLSRKFSAPPVLSQEFVEVKPADTNRIFAVDHQQSYLDSNGNLVHVETDRIQAQINFKITAKRPLPKDATPRL